MASTASDLLKLELQADGENDTTWGSLAVVLFERLEEAVAEQIGISLASLGGANYTLDDTQYVKNSGTTAESHAAKIKATGTMDADEQIIIPLRNKSYLIWNATGGAFTTTVIGATGTGVIVPQGYMQHVICDGTNVEAASPPFDTNGQAYSPKGTDIASASPLVLLTDGDMFDVTGTTGFSAMTVAKGRYFTLQFDGALTMTHGAGTLDLPDLADITTAAGGTAFCYSTAANVVRVLSYSVTTPSTTSIAGAVETSTSAENLAGTATTTPTVAGAYEIAFNRDATPASDHTVYGPQTNTLNAGYTNALFDLVYLNADGEWYEADADATGTSINMLGLALEVSSDGAALNVALPGCFIRDDTWTWTIGGPLYASGTLGAMTQTAPSGSGDVVRVVGFAVTADVVFFQPSPDYITVA
jgi:hypothetical protein